MGRFHRLLSHSHHTFPDIPDLLRSGVQLGSRFQDEEAIPSAEVFDVLAGDGGGISAALPAF